MDREQVGKEIVDSAIKVHKSLGPGLLESAYQQCLSIELTHRGLDVRTEIYMPVRYAGKKIDNAFRMDMLVENEVVIENKVVEVILPVHKSQVLTYLRLSNLVLGYLLNWNVALMKNGIFRIQNDPNWQPEKEISRRE